MCVYFTSSNLNWTNIPLCTVWKRSLILCTRKYFCTEKVIKPLGTLALACWYNAYLEDLDRAIPLLDKISHYSNLIDSNCTHVHNLIHWIGQEFKIVNNEHIYFSWAYFIIFNVPNMLYMYNLFLYEEGDFFLFLLECGLTQVHPWRLGLVG